VTTSRRRKRTQRLVILAAWAAAIVSYVVYSRSRGLSAIDAAEELRSVLADNWWGAPLFIAVYVLRPVVLFPASVLTVLGGIAFGLVGGVALTVVASNLSTAASYGVGRYFAPASLVDRGPGPISAAIGRAVHRPFETTLIMRLIALPFDAVGYLGGFAQLRFWSFLAGSALGTVAGTIAFVSFGASIDSLEDGSPEIDLRLIALSVVLTAASILFARWLRARRPLNPQPAALSPEVSS
jgi:uncharacterized membrane protein YdjX (TVP38/TMEM64 family)